MATNKVQTSHRHSREIQREFERIGLQSDKVVKTTNNKSTVNPVNNNNTPDNNIDNGYTVSHNLDVIGLREKNTQTDYVDGNISNGIQYDVIFDVTSNENNTSMAHVSGYVNIPRSAINPEPNLWYKEEFLTDHYFPNQTKALLSGETNIDHRFGTKVYRDIKHNFNLIDPDDYIYTITYIGDKTRMADAVVRTIDKDTVRVYSSVRFGITDMATWQVGNTRLLFNPSMIDLIIKENVPKFVIVLHTNRQGEIVEIIFINGGVPSTVHDTVLNGGTPDTIHSIVINGGTA